MVRQCRALRQRLRPQQRERPLRARVRYVGARPRLPGQHLQELSSGRGSEGVDGGRSSGSLRGRAVPAGLGRAAPCASSTRSTTAEQHGGWVAGHVLHRHRGRDLAQGRARRQGPGAPRRLPLPGGAQGVVAGAGRHRLAARGVEALQLHRARHAPPQHGHGADEPLRAHRGWEDQATARGERAGMVGRVEGALPDLLQHARQRCQLGLRRS
mmetsp:Transcript_16841/g.44511  ORF Transcript_16841/g.44511 Transcript_16841/m.44511 type:complete len:212 (-) Transcript_16841:1358-1993(-)